MTTAVTIDSEFRSLIPPLTAEEYTELERSIRREGCRDALVVWEEQGLLLDGHHRHAICEAQGLPYRVVPLALSDRSAAMEWIIRHQFARRNLTPYQRAELALRLEPVIAAQAAERMKAGKRRDPMQNSAQGSTREEVAKVAGISHDTLAKASLITPDLLVFKGSKICWMEAKTKSAFTWHRQTGTWQTGIDRRHWLDYVAVSERTPFPVWLMFLHKEGAAAKDTPEGMQSPSGLFAQEIGHLRATVDHEHEGHGPSGMVYWRVSALRRVCDYAEVAQVASELAGVVAWTPQKQSKLPISPKTRPQVALRASHRRPGGVEGRGIQAFTSSLGRRRPWRLSGCY